MPTTDILAIVSAQYFSAIERLQFEKSSSEVDRIFRHYDLTSHSSKHQRHRAALSSPENLAAVPHHRGACHSFVTAESDSSWVLNFPDKTSKAELTREEQVSLIKHLRASVILDAANEAISKAVRAPDRSLSPTPDIDHSTATLSSRRGSLDSMVSTMAHLDSNGKDPVRESLYDSFRWLDEEDDLDLGLFMDDYHANLREEVSQTGKNRRPSFRRRLSVSKLPFGRPDARDAKDVSPVQGSSQTQQPITTHRRLSRTLSVMNPGKQVHSEPAVQVVDPRATHYQDPEARQKLRVYLASPSKFDEAIQFGFPAGHAQDASRSSERKPHSRAKHSDDSENMRSFLDFDGDEEDEQSDHDDASSASDLDSPKTPQMGGLTPPPGHHRPMRSSTDPLIQSSGCRQTSSSSKPTTSDSYIPNPTSSREMTLRMTLTRPDLRANEELIYGWQPHAAYVNPVRKSQTILFKDDAPTSVGQTTTACWSEGHINKDSIEDMLVDLDHCNADGGVAGGDQGVMKRIWNKVRRS